MKKHLRVFMLLACFLTGIINVCKAQTQFWSDDLESASPSSGTRTPSYSGGSGGPPNTRYFKQTTLANINSTSPFYQGIQGTQCWAAEDVDAAPTGVTNEQSSEQSVTWSSINIVGKTGLSFRGLFATTLATVWDHGTATLLTDYIKMQYQIDGGPWTDLLSFRPNILNATIGALAVDGNADGLGDGIALNNTFTDFTANITGTGTTLNIRCQLSANSLQEEVAFDNFRLFETAPCTAPSITSNPLNRSICAGTNTTFVVSATGATAYQWQVDQTGGGTYSNLSNSAPYSNVTTSTLTITGATAGMNGYRYRAVAINGVASCFTNSNYGTLSVSSINTSSASQTNIACFGGSTGNASVSPSGGIGAYTYSWSPSGGTAATATGLAQGSYTVTVTDAISCQATRTFTITQPAAAVGGSTITTNIACFGGTNGTIDLTPSGGTPGYTYNWGGGITTQDRVSLAAGNYSVTITDANNCTGTVNATVTQPATPISGNYVVTNIACYGGTNGSIDLTPSGGTPGYTYNWGGGITTQDRTGLAAGNYSVTITDANSCTKIVNVTVTQPASAVSGSTVVTNVACFGGTNGAIDLTPSGGTPGYSYNWGGGVFTQDRTGRAAGNYSVTITDANSCTGIVNVTITQPASAVSGSTVVTNITCPGAATGTINLTPSGGTPGYTYSWTGGPTTEDRVGVTAGTYTVTITDDNGCTGTVNPTVTEPASIPGSNNYSLPTSNKTVIKTVSNANFVTASCELINSVVASGGSPVSGSVTNKVWIEGAVPTQSGAPFVQRHYEITPAVNASTATGTVTLYFTQAEFDNFNAHAASALNLPIDASDNAGKANLRIGKYSGVSGNGTGLPSSYSSSKMVIDPDDNNIVWNAVSNSWEITFDVNGFSGFIVQTATFTLPVNWTSFTVNKQNQSVVLNWSTATEQNTKDFTVQYSTDGVNWNNAAILAAAGNSSSTRSYRYVHHNPAKGYNYYRIMQTDLDGKTNYSEVRVLDLSGDHAAFTIANNKVSNGIVQVQVHQTVSISLYEVSGKLLWKKQFTPGSQNLDVSSYSKGVYLLSAEGKSQKILIQ